MTSKQFFNVQQHSYTILNNLSKLRQENTLCDVILQVENKTFPAHRNVLSAASEYFLKMFTTNMREKQERKVALKDMSSIAMEAVIGFIYTGDVTITEENISSILNAASLMQIIDLLKIVVTYLCQFLNLNNCLRFRKLGVLHVLDKLVDEANQYILKHFEKISKEEEFYDLNIDEIEFILRSDDLAVDEEKQVYEVVVNWVNKDLQNRKQHFPKLFKYVRLQFVPVKFVAETIRKNELVREFLDCRDLVEDAFFFHISPEMVKAEHPRLSYKFEPDSVMFINASMNYQDIFHVKTKSWSQKTTNGWRVNIVNNYCAVASKHSIHVFCGGVIDDQVTNAVVQFDGNEWKQIDSMIEARCGTAPLYYKNDLYVFGGENIWVNPFQNYGHQQSSNNFVKSFEVFNSEWKIAGSLRSVRSYACGETVNDKIFLIGGFTINNGRRNYSKEPTSSTDIYNVENGLWSNGPNLNVARAVFGSAVVNSIVYVLGGIGVGNSYLRNAEFLGTPSNVWTTVTTTFSHDFGIPSVCSVKGQIYLSSFYYNRMIRFDPDTQQWSIEARNTKSKLIVPICNE